MTASASTAPATAPKFRVVAIVFAWTQTSAAAFKKQAEEMFAGASVMIEPNEEKAETVPQLDYDIVKKALAEVDDVLAIRNETITALDKEIARLKVKNDDLVGAAAAAQVHSTEKAAELAAAPVKHGDILRDNHTGAYVLVSDVTGKDFLISSMDTREPLWRVGFESAAEFTPTTARDFAKAHEKFAQESAEVESKPAADESKPASGDSVKVPATRATASAPRATNARRVRPSRAKKPAAKKSRAK